MVSSLIGRDYKERPQLYIYKFANYNEKPFEVRKVNSANGRQHPDLTSDWLIRELET